MKNMKFWRTALVATLVLTVMLSVTGGTIAWFTDSVESKSNKIEAGNLDVELYMYNAITGEYDNISKAPNAIFGGADSLVAQNNNADTLWEPGKTQVAYLMIKNEGNLALQYNVDLIVQDSETDNYRVRTEDQTNGVVTMENVKINMDNDLTGLDISRGVGVVKLTKVVCKGITDEAHLDPKTQVQVEYTPYGDVLLGTKWGLEATDCEFGSLHGWNTTNGSNVSLNNTTYTVFRMHYWPNRVLYIDGVETAWSESGAIPVAHDVGGCWSVQPEFK